MACEARALFASAPTPPADPAPLASLAAPVRRSLELSGAARHAPIRAARLRHGGVPTRFTAERYRDVGGRGVLTPLHRRVLRLTVDGSHVPFRVTATWHLESGPLPYARWDVDEVELDRAEPW